MCIKSTEKKTEYCVVCKAHGQMAEYAKTELEKYIYLLTGETADAAKCVNTAYRIVFTLEISEKKKELGAEGYVIRTEDHGKRVLILAETEQGLLYGVYGLLSDHYGIGFYFSGDAIPEKKKPLPLLEITETKVPEQYIRGVLPWMNFPQSSTSYSLKDWMYIIDQMARMRMNFINIHNYNGEFGHNEMFHNYMLDGKMSRNWNATVSKPHAWGIKGWKVDEYLFGGKEVFDDYDFGADAALHNDCLDNPEVFQKGSSEMAFVIRYAHTRGVKIGLGLDWNLIMGEEGQKADDFRVVDARIHQIITDYPDLDYLLLYRSENSPNFHVWNRAFYRAYETFREKASNTRIAVSGWGLDPDTVIGLPKDVIAAPISGHSVNDRIPDGTIYGDREFWGCPWSERDYDDSIHFAPYHTLLSSTIADYQKRSKNMKGLMTLTWRLSDGVDAKLSYIAEAPWDNENQLCNSRAAYERYARKCYGAEAAEKMTDIINENEAFATNASECLCTPLPSGKDRGVDLLKAEEQLSVIERAIAETKDRSFAERLRKLYCRILAVKAFCRLDEKIESMDAKELNREFATFVQCFVRRIDDISTQGNLFSIENRYVQEWYLKRIGELQERPYDGEEMPYEMSGFPKMQVLMVSPVTAITKQSHWDISVAVLGGTGERKVQLWYRKAGNEKWRVQTLEHRVNGCYGTRIAVSELPEGVVEYYVEASCGETTARYPSTAPQLCAALSHLAATSLQNPEKPVLRKDGAMRLRWNACDGDLLWYRIYRGNTPDFETGPQSLVTYVYRDTLSYLDVSGNFDGKPLAGTWYYKVSCVDENLRESEPSNAVGCEMAGIAARGGNQVQGKGNMLVELGTCDLGDHASHMYVYYGASGELDLELWADGDSMKNGKKLGSSHLCATGRAEVVEMGDISLSEVCNGVHRLFLKVYASNKTEWSYVGLYPADMALREPGIRTEKEGVAADAEKEKAEDKTMETADSFEDFWMISDVIGCHENVEIGGLTYGYRYRCQLFEKNQILYETTGKTEQPFLIPERILETGHRYRVRVTAESETGVLRSVEHEFWVSAENFMAMTNAEKEELCLSAKEGDEYGRLTYPLPWKYLPEYPYLLIRAEALAGDWTIQINGIPVVGPKENNVAMRKDLRTFGFHRGEELELTLLVRRLAEDEPAKTIFRSVQLLSSGENSAERMA
ncbi:MAG: hypothetical protein MR332_04695 [Fusicatenibacter sp.]|nr:hypothetical protein [Fusicatenibacter sp.]